MKITALAGGVGASKFLLGLRTVMPPEDITIIVNTGDDIDLLGLRICPDIDTVTYTLAGVMNEITGWGIAGDTFESLTWLARYNEATWFKLGDRDLATHISRSLQLRQGRSLTEVTDYIRRALGVSSRILPMSNDYTPTRVLTDEREMHFQEYFVALRCQPRVKGIRFENIELAAPAPGVVAAILEADTIIICPSNPFISVGPILAVPGVREALVTTNARVIAITPIIGGKALKGPAADMLLDLGHAVSAAGVAALYGELIDLFVLDEIDAQLRGTIEEAGTRVAVTNTLMTTMEDKCNLASFVLAEAMGPR